MQPELRIAHFDLAEQILVPLERDIRVVTALQEQLHATHAYGLFNLPEDLVETERVALARSDVAIEGAESAPRHAHVGVIDVAIDDIRDDAARVFGAVPILR